MKILFIGNDFHSIYYTRKELLIELVKKHQVFVAIPQNNKNKLIEDIGCEIVPVTFSRTGKNPFFEIVVLHKIKIILNQIKPDKIFTFTIKPNIYTGLLQRDNAKCQIATITGLGRIFQRETLAKKLIIYLYRLAFRNTKTVFFENAECEKIFTEYKIALGRHIIINGAGVNLMQNPYEQYPDDTQGICLVFVGRIEPDKGFLELWEAAKFFESKNANIKFIVLGICEHKFEQKFSRLEIPSNMHLKGWKMDVHTYLKNTHGVILPSHHEGMANVLLEAASTGRPILASRIHGCVESFEDGITGLGFAKQNVADMIHTIQIFADMPNETRREMGKKGREKMEKEFDRKEIVKIFMEQLNED